MAHPVAFLFPGQGSQAVGMGMRLAADFAVARDVYAEADAILGMPLSRLCFEGPLEELTLTANTQPALLATSWAMARVIATETALRPAWMAGHSLGEISALVAAGALTFASGLRVVRERGLAMQAAVAPGIGSMAAILGLEPTEVEAICREAAAEQIVSPANLNGGGQVVIAGHREAVERASALAKERGAKRVLPLAVSAPFHCALMEPAARHLARVLAEIEVRAPLCPVFSNVDAQPNLDPLRIKDLLVRQVVRPVRWQECGEGLARLGCTVAVEVGAGKTLSGLLKRIAPTIRCVAGEDLDSLREIAAT